MIILLIKTLRKNTRTAELAGHASLRTGHVSGVNTLITPERLYPREHERRWLELRPFSPCEGGNVT